MIFGTRTVVVALCCFVVGALGQQQNQLYHDIIENAGKVLQQQTGQNGQNINMANLFNLFSKVDQQTLMKLAEEFLSQNGNSTGNDTVISELLSDLPGIISVLSKLPNSNQILSGILKSGISPSMLMNATQFLSKFLQPNANFSDILKYLQQNNGVSLPSSMDAVLEGVLKAVNLPPVLLSTVKSTLTLLQQGKMIQAIPLISSIPDLLKPGGNQTSQSPAQPLQLYGISESCKIHTRMMLEAIPKGEMWAISMLDAFGKIPSGVLEGNFKFLGSFDECRSVQATTKINNQTVPIFKGQPCGIAIPIADILKKTLGDQAAMLAAFAPYMGLGVCVPDSCTSEEIKNAWNQISAKVKLPNDIHLWAYLVNCPAKENEYDSKAKGAFALCGIFIVLMTLATMYDVVVVHWWWAKSKGAPEKSKVNGYLPNGNASDFQYRPRSSEETTPKEDKKKIKAKTEFSVPERLLLSFSMYTNGKKLLNTRQGPGSITCINGIRFLSMSWVILGHTYAFIFSATGNLRTFYSDVYNRWTFNAISNALISVDTFFTLSAFLLTYLILKEMKKKNGPTGINWFLFYFHRFWRLTPPYMLILFVCVTTYPYWSTGPMWPKDGHEQDKCSEAWWTNLLYISNIVKTDKMCFGHSWYLANDMQFYVLSPLLIIPLYLFKRSGAVVSFVFLLTTTITAGVISSVNDLAPSAMGGADPAVKHGNYMMLYYFKPWCRMGPYIIGILGGYFLYEKNGKLKINPVLNLCIWALAAGAGCAILYGLYDPLRGKNYLSNDVSALYNATHRSVWGMCVSWVIIACATGNGGYINTLLSWKGMVTLSRLTYCAYLIHPYLMYMYYDSIRQPLMLTDLSTLYLFFGHLVLSYLVAFVLSLAFESPMMGLEKVIFGGKASKREKTPPKPEEQEVEVTAEENNHVNNMEKPPLPNGVTVIPGDDNILNNIHVNMQRSNSYNVQENMQQLHVKL